MRGIGPAILIKRSKPCRYIFITVIFSDSDDRLTHRLQLLKLGLFASTCPSVKVIECHEQNCLRRKLLGSRLIKSILLAIAAELLKNRCVEIAKLRRLECVNVINRRLSLATIPKYQSCHCLAKAKEFCLENKLVNDP